MKVLTFKTIDEIGAADLKEGTFFGVWDDAKQLYAGESDWVGSKGGAGCEYAESAIAAEAGRANGGMPTLSGIGGKAPQKPDMRKAIEAAKGFRDLETGFEGDDAAETRHETALAWNAEFFGEWGMDSCDRPESRRVGRIGCHGKHFFLPS